MGFATAIYLGVDAGAGPRDTLMLALSRLGRTSLRVARTCIEITVVAVGWLLGGTSVAWNSNCRLNNRTSGSTWVQDPESEQLSEPRSE